jgi:hypothetical protein
LYVPPADTDYGVPRRIRTTRRLIRMRRGRYVGAGGLSVWALPLISWCALASYSYCASWSEGEGLPAQATLEIAHRDKVKLFTDLALFEEPPIHKSHQIGSSSLIDHAVSGLVALYGEPRL